ncbi:hypothetical protein DI495_09135 [Streptococcus dysgalactiae subsp. equisimilis]|nr:hypothetical protein DI495_09135 [Streptococcus dysgalactiae subsp. equisimilis]
MFYSFIFCYFKIYLFFFFFLLRYFFTFSFLFIKIILYLYNFFGDKNVKINQKSSYLFKNNNCCFQR